jgi:hypothetical protein
VAARAFDSLRQILQGKEVAGAPPLQPHLVVRDSTAPPEGLKRRK